MRRIGLVLAIPLLMLLVPFVAAFAFVADWITRRDEAIRKRKLRDPRIVKAQGPEAWG